MSDVTVLKPATARHPEVRRERCVDGGTVVKDYRHLRGWRRMMARWILAREERAYRILEGFNGAPRCFGREGALSIRLEFIEGKPCGLLEDEGLAHTIPPEFFDRVGQLVEELHHRGVAHNDLKRARNILVATDGRPVLIDFAAAVWRAPRWNPLRVLLFHQLCKVDHNAVAKLKRRFVPHLLNDDERRRLDHPTMLERMARRLLHR